MLPQCCMKPPPPHIKYCSMYSSHVNTDNTSILNSVFAMLQFLCFVVLRNKTVLSTKRDLNTENIRCIWSMPYVAGKQQQQISKTGSPAQQTLPQTHNDKRRHEVWKEQSSYYHKCEQNFKIFAAYTVSGDLTTPAWHVTVPHVEYSLL